MVDRPGVWEKAVEMIVQRGATMEKAGQTSVRISMLQDVLTKHGIKNEYHETDGGHTWINWRNYLLEFAPQLFQ